MNNCLVNLLLSAAMLVAPVAIADWQTREQVPRTRAEQNALAVGGQVYVLSGLNENQRTGPAQIDRYNPSTDDWTAGIGTLNRNKNHAGVVVYQDRYIILVGGKEGAPTTAVRWVDQYDTQTNSWERLPDLPADVWAAPAVMIGDKLHVISGAATNSSAATHHFQLDLSNVGAGWVSKASIPVAVVHAGAALLNGRVYVVGGESAHTHPSNGQYDLTQIYTPATDSWSQGPAIPIARNHIENSMFTYGGKIWSVSGVDSSRNPRGQVEVLSFDGTSWVDEDMDLPDQLVGASAVAVNDTIYVMGGWRNTWTPANLTRSTLAFELSSVTPPVTPPVTIPEVPPNFTVE